MKCPQCQNEATKVGDFWICPTHGQLPEPKPFVPMRIFLSYGHDSNEELVRRIKADLEKRGHTVWFDQNEIKFGDEWRRSITDGIVDSHRVLSFLSKHSTRDPGVCRDEIAIAIGVKGGNIQTILVESEQDVQPPVNIGHIQWLDMHDWIEQRAAGEAAWAQWYRAKLAEIVRVVESDESRRFAGEIETLNDYLKPIKSEARICQLLSKGFYGRQWLFEAVENWRSPQSKIQNQKSKIPSRLFWIMGVPGVGKSAFAAQLTHTRGDTVIAAQFCEWDKPDHRNAPRVVRSLAFQLATRLPDYRKLLLTLPEIAELDRPDPITKRTKNEAELFDYLLANPLRSVINGGRERYLIVIDALDEAGETGGNPLVKMLAKNAQLLPDWLGLVVTSRPEFDVKTPLQALNPFSLDTQSESNRTDIRDYLRRELATPLQNRPDADRLVEQILEKSEGVFLYVERFCDDVQHGHVSLDHPEKFPQGLGGIFLQYFQRQFQDEEKYEKTIEPALGAILAAREPMPVDVLQKAFAWRETELRKWLRKLGSLFPVTKEANKEVIKPFHKSLADWMADDAKAGAFFVSVVAGHRMLRDFCRRSWTQETFALAHLPSHLAQCGDWHEMASVLINPEFIRAKRSRLGYAALAFDYQWAEACSPELKSDIECRLLKRVSEAVKSLSGFLGRSTETARVEEFLRSIGHRHLVVVGPPGIGKTLFLKHVWLEDIRSRVFIELRYDRQIPVSRLTEHISKAVSEECLGQTANPTESKERLRFVAEYSPSLQTIIVDGLDEAHGTWDTSIPEAFQCRLKFVWGTRDRQDIVHAFGDDTEFIQLPSMSSGQAMEYFMERGLGDLATQSELGRLIEWTEGLPLAVAMMAAHVKETGSVPSISPNPQLRMREILNRALEKARQHNPSLDSLLRPLVVELAHNRSVVWEEFALKHSLNESALAALEQSKLLSLTHRDGQVLISVVHMIFLEFLKGVYEAKQ